MIPFEICSIGDPKPLYFRLLLPIGTDDPHASERFLDHRTHVGQLSLYFLKAAMNRTAEEFHQERHKRQRYQCDQCQTEIDREHQNDRNKEHEDSVDRVHNGWSGHHANRTEVVRRTRHDVARALGLKIA